MWWPSLLRILLLAVALSWPAAAEAAKRAALVIGNSAYRHAPELPNPRNDARALAPMLERIGFEVMLGLDLDRAGFDALLRDFARTARDAETVTFFYAGHGLQVAGENYLVPVDARLQSEADLLFEAVKLSFVMQILESRPRTSIVFLDACRDNPLAENLARSLGRTRSALIGRGLAEVSAGAGTLVAYATDPGNVALDGEGEHSPFTEALLRHIAEPGVEVRSMLTRVRRDVYEATGGRQRPWDNSSLLREFYFVEKPVETAAAEPEPEPRTATTQQTDPAAQARDLGALERERIFWQGIQNSLVPGDFEAYLQLYPEGMFAPLARARLERLKAMSAGERVALLPPAPEEPPRAERVIRMKQPEEREPAPEPGVEAAGPPPAAERPTTGTAPETPAPAGVEVAALPPGPAPEPAKPRPPEGLVGILPVPKPPLPEPAEAAPPERVAARTPEAAAAPASSPPRPVFTARELLARAADLELVAMSRVPGEHICTYDGTFRHWEETRDVPDLGSPLSQEAADRAALRLAEPGAEGGMVAEVAANGRLAVTAHIRVDNPSRVFSGVAAGSAVICDPGTARWKDWRFLGERGEALDRSYVSTGGFRVRYVALRLGAPQPLTCLAFEGTGRRTQWLGGFFCEPGERPLGAAELMAWLGRTRFAGALGN